MRTTFGSPRSTNPKLGSSAVSHTDSGSSESDDSSSVGHLRNGAVAPHRTRLDAEDKPDSRPVADAASIGPVAVTGPPASVALPTVNSDAARITGIAARFWLKVDKNGPVVRPELGPCWVWTGARVSGYGVLRVGKGVSKASRVSWELAYGAIPARLWALHRCDNPACVRPEHLFLGTPLDNSRDCVAKGRKARGEQANRGPLTADRVRRIVDLLRAGHKAMWVAMEFGVCEGTVSRIKRGRIWVHITGGAVAL